MPDRIAFTVVDDDVGQRIDAMLSRHVSGLSRSAVQRMIQDGYIRCNQRAVKAAYRVAAGDQIEGEIFLPPAISAAPEDIPLTVVYRDADLAVIDKPAGLVVHPAPGHPGGTLANALAALFPQAQGVGSGERPGIVHRLDKDTSGLLVVALSAAAHAALQSQIAERSAQRIYLALAAGGVNPPEGVIDAPIGRHLTERTRMAAHGLAARPARTTYRTLEHIGGFSFLEASLQTGRTHQIRVHFAASGHPLAGDTTYRGPAIHGLARQFLHAHRLVVTSPSTGDRLEFESPLPQDLQCVIDRLHRM